MTVLKVADEGKWVRLMSAKGHYRHTVSKKTFEQTPPRYSIAHFSGTGQHRVPEDQIVTSLDHEIWDVLDNGSEK